MRYFTSIVFVYLLSFPPASFANLNVSEKLEALIQAGRSEFKTMLEICNQSFNSQHCTWARWRVHEAEQQITGHPAFPKNYQPHPLKNCLYVGAVACSLLGGPDPAEQGLTPLSSLTGQELTFPLEHHRKNPTESASGGRDSD